jgi:uncharacterized protein YidB (DUF937 family)
MGLLDDVLGGLTGGGASGGSVGGPAGGGLGGALGGVLGGALGGNRSPAGGGGDLQRMLVQAAIAMVVAHAARGAVAGRGGNAPAASAGGAGGGLGDVLGGLLGGGAGAGGLGAVLGGGGGLGGMLGGAGAGAAGGLGGLLGPLLDSFTQHGHGDAAASWVARGQNAPISPQAVDQVFGSDAIDSIANQLGIGRDEAARGVAQVLPEVVDHLTPDGQVPDGSSQLASLEELARRIGPR